MSDRPITPSRIIPAAAHLPARPPKPDEVPPWRDAPPAMPPPPREPRDVFPVEQPRPVMVHVTIEQAPPEQKPEATWWQRTWASLEDWARPWQTLTAATAVLLPWFTGESIVTAWSSVTADCRTEASIGAAYVLAGTALGVALLLDHRTGRWLPRALVITTAVGGLGALGWFDPVTFVTGVTR